VLLPAARSPLPRLDRAVVRSIARRAPIWQLQPRRRSRYQTPGIVYCTVNLAPIRSRTRASVHRWTTSRRRRPSAAEPPPCAYLIYRAYRLETALLSPPL
jgi:hypothetical protein